MRKSLFILGILSLSLACQPVALLSTPTPPTTATVEMDETLTPFPPGNLTATPNITPTPTLTLTPTLNYPLKGYGPTNFPANINPLTGLKVNDPLLLDRRPVMVKVSNLPRLIRPQAGLSLADIVYEYYTEEGTTRFAAIFYGQDASKVGSIRSGRFFDTHLISMYNCIFAFGSADQRVLDRFRSAGHSKYLILEWHVDCPALCREAPNGYDMLFGNTQELSAFATRKGIENERQNLDGMLFQSQPPGGWMPGTAEQVYVRFSSVIYNRWDYNPASGRYFRFSETDNDTTGGQNEVYAQLTDALTGQPIATDNLIVILTPHQYYSLTPEIVDIALEGRGTAYAFRDGQVYQLSWQRPAKDAVLTLTNPDGSPFPFKPGTTWFEVMGTSSIIEQNTGSWRFRLRFP